MKNNNKIKYKLRAKIILKNKMVRENARTHVQRRCSLQITGLLTKYKRETFAVMLNTC